MGMGEPYESINRIYLKLKAQMLPYYYSYARESYDTGVPMVRALMLEYPEEEFTMGNQTQYEYLWGENLLVAPVYDEAENNAEVRNKIYLPGGEDQVWIDYFTGEQYTGGKVVNSIDAPLWKLPLFVKSGAIIPMTVENNSVQELTGEEPRIFDVYPDGDSSFTLYDDGYSQAYQNGEGSFTEITSHEQDGTADITVGKMSGSFEGMKSERETQFIVHTYAKPQSVQATVGGSEAELQEAADREAFEAAEGNAYYYDEAPANSAYYDGADNGAPRLYVKIAATDITANEVKLHVEGIVNRVEQEIVDDTLPMAATAPQIAETSSSAITLSFDVPEGMQADLEIDGMLYENVTSPFIHDSLNPDEEHTYRLRYTNTLGSGEFSEQVSAKTDLDPYRNVISGAVATANSYEDIPRRQLSAAEPGSMAIWPASGIPTGMIRSITQNLRSSISICRWRISWISWNTSMTARARSWIMRSSSARTACIMSRSMPAYGKSSIRMIMSLTDASPVMCASSHMISASTAAMRSASIRWMAQTASLRQTAMATAS